VRAVAALFQRDISLGLPLKANVRHVFVADDTAQTPLWVSRRSHLAGFLKVDCFCRRAEIPGVV
jgi:hypothetical protein